jgi:type I restriction enzyme S subunit
MFKKNKFKLKDFLLEYSQKNTNNDIFEIYSVGGKGIRKRSEVYDRELSENNQNYKIIFLNTLTIGMGSKQIDFGVFEESEKGLVSPAYSTYKIDSINSKYLKYWLDYHNPILSNQFMITGARQGKSVNKKGLLDNEISTHTRELQIKIGLFFENLDQLIDRQNTLIKTLKKIKSIYLNNIFLLDDNFFPEIRFSGFKEKWELSKLEKFSSKVKEKNKGFQYSEIFTNSAEFGVLNQQEYFGQEVNVSKKTDGYYIVRNNDFVYNPRISKLAPVGPINRNRLNRSGIMSPLYIIFRINKISPLFLEKYFETTHWHDFMRLNGDSGARDDRFSIKNKTFFKMPIPVPSSLEEQNKIGYFFDMFDNFIDLNQKKLRNYQNYKKNYLSKIFKEKD